MPQMKGMGVIANIANKYPDRFLGFAVINPRWYRESVDEVIKAKEELGMVGLKFHPASCHYRENKKRRRDRKQPRGHIPRRN